MRKLSLLLFMEKIWLKINASHSHKTNMLTSNPHSMATFKTIINNVLITKTPNNENIHFTFFSSTSKIRVELGGMTGGEPLAPYLGTNNLITTILCQLSIIPRTLRHGYLVVKSITKHCLIMGSNLSVIGQS